MVGCTAAPQAAQRREALFFSLDARSHRTDARARQQLPVAPGSQRRARYWKVALRCALSQKSLRTVRKLRGTIGPMLSSAAKARRRRSSRKLHIELRRAGNCRERFDPSCEAASGETICACALAAASRRTPVRYRRVAEQADARERGIDRRNGLYEDMRSPSCSASARSGRYPGGGMRSGRVRVQDGEPGSPRWRAHSLDVFADKGLFPWEPD